MSRNKLALAAGLLSVFMTAAPALAENAAPPVQNNETPETITPEKAAAQKQMIPFMTVKTFLPAAPDKPVIAVIGSDAAFKKYMADIRKTAPGARIELDGAMELKTAEGTAGYISYFENWDISGADLSGTTIRNAVFFGTKAAKTSFDNATFENVMLAGIKAGGSTWRNVVFDITDPEKAVRGGGCIEGANTNLSGADFTGAVFIGMNWGNTNLQGAILPAEIRAAVRNPGQKDEQRIETSFEGAILQNAILTGAKVSETSMSHADIRGADLRGTEFRNMKDMLNMHFDDNTKVAGTSFIRSVPPYLLLELKERQEKSSAAPQLHAWRPGR